MPDDGWIGCVGDIDGLPVTISTSRGRVRVAVGSSVAVLGQEESEEFAQLFVRASWQAAIEVAQDG